MLEPLKLLKITAFSLMTVTFSALSGCDASIPKEFTLNQDPAKLKWKLGASNADWKAAYESCEAISKTENVPWRLATVNEIHQKYSNDPMTLATDNYVWSALFNEQGVHYTVNLDNGAKQWRGDNILAQTLCVTGESTDKDAWIEEVYNSRALGRIGHIVDIVKRQAAKGNAAAQVELGNMYLHGNGVNQEDAQAAKWYSMAAERGQQMGALNLAEMKRVGRAQ